MEKLKESSSEKDYNSEASESEDIEIKENDNKKNLKYGNTFNF